MPELKLAIIVGSNRSGSINRQLAEAIAKLAADSFEVRFVRTDDLPLYNQDLEANFPESAERMKQAIVASDGILVVTPEHNRSIPAALKSAIDWASRPPGKGVWSGKPIAITGTSRGSIGTAVAQQHLRAILGNIGGLVMPGQTFVTFREGLVDENHAITDEKTRAFLQAFIAQFASLVAKLTR